MVFLEDRIDRDVYVTSDNSHIKPRKGCEHVQFLLFVIDYPPSLFLYTNGNPLPVAPEEDEKDGIRKRRPMINWSRRAHLYYNMPGPYRSSLERYPRDTYRLRFIIDALMSLLHPHDRKTVADAWFGKKSYHRVDAPASESACGGNCRGDEHSDHTLLSDVCASDLNSPSKLIRDKIVCDIHGAMRWTNGIWVQLHRDFPVFSHHEDHWKTLLNSNAESYGIVLNRPNTQAAFKYALDQEEAALEVMGNFPRTFGNQVEQGTMLVRPPYVTREWIKRCSERGSKLDEGSIIHGNLDLTYSWNNKVPTRLLPVIQLSMLPDVFPVSVHDQIIKDLSDFPPPEIRNVAELDQLKAELFLNGVDMSPSISLASRSSSLTSSGEQVVTRYPRVLTISFSGSAARIEPKMSRLIRCYSDDYNDSVSCGTLQYAFMHVRPRPTSDLHIRYSYYKNDDQVVLHNNETMMFFELDRNKTLRRIDEIEQRGSWAGSFSASQFLNMDPPTPRRDQLPPYHTTTTSDNAIKRAKMTMSSFSSGKRSSFAAILSRSSAALKARVELGGSLEADRDTTESHFYDVVVLYKICDPHLLRHAYRFAKKVIIVTSMDMGKVVGEKSHPISATLSTHTGQQNADGWLETLTTLF